MATESLFNVDIGPLQEDLLGAVEVYRDPGCRDPNLTPRKLRHSRSPNGQIPNVTWTVSTTSLQRQTKTHPRNLPHQTLLPSYRVRSRSRRPIPMMRANSSSCQPRRRPSSYARRATR